MRYLTDPKLWEFYGIFLIMGNAGFISSTAGFENPGIGFRVYGLGFRVMAG